MKTCSQCGQEKPLDQFHRFAAARDGRRADCAECSCARVRRNYDANLRANFDTGLLRLDCKHCGEPFEYVKTTGRRRWFCSERCRYEAGEAAKKARAAKLPPRACRCGSTAVARTGTPCCQACRTEQRDPAVSRAKERRRTLRKYGITEADWDRMIAAQRSRCAICRTDKPGGKDERWHIDHDHESGRVRGLLCHGCNTSLGHFRDDPNILVAALHYLGYETTGTGRRQETIDLERVA